jgi:Ca2+-binding EF-hand superfamily protein
MKNAKLITGLATVLALAGTGAVLAERHDERAGMRPAFEEIDSDGDGRITQAEMTEQMQARFDGADADGDGALSREELITRMTARHAEKIGQRADRMIERTDADGDGQLSMQELQDGRQGAMMARMDRDGDGAVSRDEFAKGHARHGERHHGSRGGNAGE